MKNSEILFNSFKYTGLCKRYFEHVLISNKASKKLLAKIYAEQSISDMDEKYFFTLYSNKRTKPYMSESMINALWFTKELNNYLVGKNRLQLVLELALLLHELGGGNTSFKEYPLNMSESIINALWFTKELNNNLVGKYQLQLVLDLLLHELGGGNTSFKEHPLNKKAFHDFCKFLYNKSLHQERVQGTKIFKGEIQYLFYEYLQDITSHLEQSLKEETLGSEYGFDYKTFYNPISDHYFVKYPSRDAAMLRLSIRLRSTLWYTMNKCITCMLKQIEVFCTDIVELSTTVHNYDEIFSPKRLRHHINHSNLNRDNYHQGGADSYNRIEYFRCDANNHLSLYIYKYNNKSEYEFPVSSLSEYTRVDKEKSRLLVLKYHIVNLVINGPGDFVDTNYCHGKSFIVITGFQRSAQYLY